ncbi:MAG: histidine kinase, partial [Betaproteobacteria bacterium]|nr:histidine kinase [Betaproteobacteria bacterium]
GRRWNGWRATFHAGMASPARCGSPRIARTAGPCCPASALYRIVQEGLTNIARHAGATQAAVNLDRKGRQVLLHLQDNGRGFDPASPQAAGCSGIKGIRERVYLLGGQVEFYSRPGQGTVVQVALPLAQAAP